jgi:peptide/nickel transport system ATP-binding protein
LRDPRITRQLIVGVLMLTAVVVFAIVGPLVVDEKMARVGATTPRLAPNLQHFLGTDTQGRDLWTVMALGVGNTLKIGLIAGFVGVGIGLVLALIAGFFGGLPDSVIRIISDSLLTVPAIAILVIIASNVEQMTIEIMALTVAALAWMFPCRTIRSQVLSIRDRSYVEVARANGVGSFGSDLQGDHANLMPFVDRQLRRAVAVRCCRHRARGGAWPRCDPDPDPGRDDLLVAGIHRGPARVLVVVGTPDRDDRLHLPGPVRDLGRHGSVRQPTTPSRLMAIETRDPTVEPAAPGPSPVLRVENLKVVYRTSAGDVPAVDDVSFDLLPGERLGLIGESGSGKTTMATALLRMTRPPGKIIGGRVVLAGQDLMPLDDAALRKIRLRDIAFVPQGAMNSLNPVMRIEDQMIDAILAHESGGSKKALDARVTAQLAKVGLPPEIARRYPHELSGGMKQRTVMAISTVLHPKVIVADEPTSALDVVVQRQVMQTLGRLQGEIGSAVVLIGHDMGLIAQFADLIGVMYAGRLVEIGPVDEILSSPRHPYTRLLIDSLPKLTGKGKLVGIPGLPPALLSLPPGCAFHPRCPFAFDRCEVEIPADAAVAPNRLAACHLYPDHAVLPPLPSSVQLDPDAPMDVTPAAMEGREDPGRADAEARLAAAMAEDGGPGARPPDSALGISELGQSDLDELHHRKDH